MKNSVDCPYCDGKAALSHSKQRITYKKEEFDIQAHFYKCEKCGEDFTTTETDELSMIQVYNLYREKHRIPFPQEISLIREQYGLSAAAMSEVLGLGINGYAQYERGEIPTEAIGNLILSARNPWSFKTMLEGAIEIEPKSTFKKSLLKVELIIGTINNPKPFYNQIDTHRKPNSFTGFKTPNLEVIRALISTFIAKCNPMYNDRLKINKLFFYTDFLAYKLSGYSISGFSYRAIQYGPVPSCYDNIFALFENDMTIFSDWQLDKWNCPRELFFTRIEPQIEFFNKFEHKIVSIICNTFQESPSWDLVELSHKEKGWIELNKSHELINYQEYAFELNEINID